MPLPSPHQFLTVLLSTTTTATTTASSPSPHPLSRALHPTLLTLHCLFPTELLPALDLLDHSLVTPFTFTSRAEDAHAREAAAVGVAEAEAEAEAEAKAEAVVYYVQSSRSAQRGRPSRGSASYEVRLKAWNCSCPAFVFASFGAEDEGVGGRDEGGRVEDGVGGLRVEGRRVPVCKHLLACFLAENGGALGAAVERKVVGKEELAGWAAGWGD